MKPEIEADLQRCDSEIASAEAELRSGNPDVQGLTRALVDWKTERRLIEEGK